MSARYSIKPKATRDIDEYADYLAEAASLGVALRFLDEAHDTFALLAQQPNMGWRSRVNYPGLAQLKVFRVRGFENMVILYRPLSRGVDILRVIHRSRNLGSLLRREGIE